MNIVLDATVFEEPITGIAKVTLFLYRHCLRLMPSLVVTGLHRRPLKTAIDPAIRPAAAGTFLPKAAWRKVVLPVMLFLRRDSLAHFPSNGDIPSLVKNRTVITTLHDVLPLTIPDYFTSSGELEAYRRGKQADIFRSDLLITDSMFSKQEILKHFIVRKEPYVIYPGCTLEIGRRELHLGAEWGDEFFLYVGGYDPRKGIEQLLTVFLDLHREKKLLSKLVLTGSPNYFSSRLKNLIQEGTQSGFVEEKGYVSDDILAGLYERAKALIYPSKYEGFGLPALEAMQLGCPVATT